jgi:hypothetical protein
MNINIYHNYYKAWNSLNGWKTPFLNGDSEEEVYMEQL